MNISIFGLGYVGAVTAGCLAKQGHTIIGVDVHPQKVDALNQGIPPIVEPSLEELLKDARVKGRLRATLSCDEAIAASDLSIVCVGTPSNVAGALDLTFVRRVSREIADALRAKRRRHALVLRSTMLPGSTAQLVEDAFADLVRDGSLGVFYFPEFLRESTAVKDFQQPSLTVVGTRDGGRPPAELMCALFHDGAAVVVDWQTAEMVKYACNAFHAAKMTFANEIGRVGKQVGVDARAVMELLCRDTRLNLSPLYLKPGNPFGGSCLPKDVRALTNHARVQGVTLPLLENILLSNERHLHSLLALIERAEQREVVILGLTFKANTDDLRESAMVEVAQGLLGRGYQLRIYDPALNLSALIGANKRVIDTKMPHLACLLKRDLAAAVGQCGLIVAAQQCATIADLKKCVTPQHHVLDVNGWPELRELPARYEGFCW
jgi:GDP-mannose 6-dehydrogenase